MKQIVMATTNDNKVKRIKALLKDLEYNIVKRNKRTSDKKIF